jgi:hypothetical protein
MSVLSWFCNIDVEAAKAKLAELAEVKTAAYDEAVAILEAAAAEGTDAVPGAADPFAAEEPPVF